MTTWFLPVQLLRGGLMGLALSPILPQLRAWSMWRRAVVVSGLYLVLRSAIRLVRGAAAADHPIRLDVLRGANRKLPTDASPSPSRPRLLPCWRTELAV